jgi:hypothetical protein
MARYKRSHSCRYPCTCRCCRAPSSGCNCPSSCTLRGSRHRTESHSCPSLRTAARSLRYSRASSRRCSDRCSPSGRTHKLGRLHRTLLRLESRIAYRIPHTAYRIIRPRGAARQRIALARLVITMVPVAPNSARSARAPISLKCASSGESVPVRRFSCPSVPPHGGWLGTQPGAGGALAETDRAGTPPSHVRGAASVHSRYARRSRDRPDTHTSGHNPARTRVLGAGKCGVARRIQTDRRSSRSEKSAADRNTGRRSRSR